MTFKIYISSLKVNSKEMYDISFENNSFSRYMQDSYKSRKSVIKNHSLVFLKGNSRLRDFSPAFCN